MLSMNFNMTNELVDKHDLIVIDIDLATRKLQRAISSKYSSKINKIAHALRVSAFKAGQIDRIKMEEFINEIHELYSEVDTNPKKFMKDQS